MSQPVYQNIAQETKTSLDECFAQRVIPLEQQYLAGLQALRTTLFSQQEMAELSPAQRDELSAWVDELDRRIITYQTLCTKYLDALNSEQQRELMTFMLFGDTQTARAQKNIQEHIQLRSEAVSRINERLADLHSPEALKRQLQQRLEKEIHIRRFLDESTHYRPVRKTG